MRITFGHWLFIGLLMIGLWTGYRYIEVMSPTWQVIEAQKSAIDLRQREHDAQVDAIEHERRAADWTLIQDIFLIVVVVGAGGWIGVTAWAHYDRRRESWARAVDGQFALQHFNQAGQAFLVDPNKTVFGVFGQEKRTGNLISDANMIGADRQLTYAQDVQRTRTAAAVTGGDGFRYAATGKYLAGGYDRPGRPTEQLQLEDHNQELPPNWQPLTVVDAFNQSDRFKWIIGQNKKTGELCTLNPKENSHFGIVGSNGTGKTAYVALLLMAYALKNRFRVVILDGKGGADWSKYRHLVEYYSLDYSNVTEIVAQLYREYESRQAVLNDYQANSIWELPKGAAVPRPTLVLIDEFGAVMDSLKAADKQKYKSFSLDLGNLLRLSRGAGMYVCPCDQNPTRWPDVMRANMPVNVCFRLGGGIGGAVSEYNLDRLDRVGHFQMSNVDYHAWPTYKEIDGLLATLDYKKPKALLTVQQELHCLPTAQRTPTDDTIDEPSIVDGGEDKGKNTPPIYSRPTINDSKPSPVSYRPSIDAASIIDGAIDGQKPPLTGKPISEKERSLVRNTYALTGQYKKTCEILWGKWNPSRDAWAKAIVAEGETLQ